MAGGAPARRRSALDAAPHVQADDRATWRAWLEANHATQPGAWLVTWKPGSGVPGLDYEAAVEEALCFGWIDSTGGRVDDRRSKLYFARRKPRSVWAASNKARVERLIAAGHMAPAGLAAIERARGDGSWDVLDTAERQEVPDDLRAALDADPAGAGHWDTYPASLRKMLLGWIATARRPETRAARVAETARLAARGERPRGWRREA
ncbi:MAG: YdeI/OmpD-associated family protein [Chloroflexi bacterium]|nr:YdeI/OmpD-associated family protein [Chloroflexota bacterium]